MYLHRLQTDGSHVQLSEQTFALSMVKHATPSCIPTQPEMKQSTRAALKHIGIFCFQVQRNKHDILP